MSGRNWLIVGAVLGGLGVVCGAFGAHLLEERELVPPERLETWEIAVRYQLVHALALVLVGVLQWQGPRGAWLSAAGWCFTLGVLLFSGLLYTLALSGISMLGAIVPLGGLAMIAGWVALAVGAARLAGPPQ